MPRPLEPAQRFASHASAFGISIPSETLAMFATYERELLSWNKRMNLIAKGDEPKLWIRHFLDSLIGWSLGRSLIPNPYPLIPAVIDIGTGAGFPGLPIKLVWPEVRLVLLESIRKKTLFLTHLVGVLRLAGVTVLNARAESLVRDPAHAGLYDFVLARAVGSVEDLKKLGFPLLKDAGNLIAWRGEEPSRHPALSSYRLPGESRKRNILILSGEESPDGS